MNNLFRRSTKIGLALSGMLVLGLVVRTQQLRAQKPIPSQIRIVPAEGRMENDTKGTIPGNPNNGREDLKEIYAAIKLYQDEHTGTYPANIQALMTDLMKRLPRDESPTLRKKQFQEVMQMFLNPDSQYADNPVARESPTRAIAYQISNKRPDGTLIGSDKQTGKKDVFASTDIYVHENIRELPKQRSTSNPVGFHMVLWDDGIIEQIPYDQIMYLPVGEGDFKTVFPHQAGVPSSALTYDQYYQQMGAKKGPRGGVGAKGHAYDD